jgi:hypothetical protein
MLAWLRDLTSRERRTMLGCWGGWTLDGFDQQLYSYVVPTVIAVWGMSTGSAGTIGTITVVTSSFGGWFAGARRRQQVLAPITARQSERRRDSQGESGCRCRLNPVI